MQSELDRQKCTYADLLVHTGINLKRGQSLRVSAEIAHRPFVRIVVGAAYKAGAKLVHVDWIDTPANKQRYLYSDSSYLDYFPEYEVDRHQYFLDNNWARLALVGPEYPSVYDDVDPSTIRRVSVARSKKLQFYMDKIMSNQVQWCVAGVATRAWATRVFPDLPATEAYQELWRTILATCRVDNENPTRAWGQHDERLKQVVDTLMEQQVTSLRFIDSALDNEGKPLTDLTIGLTEQPNWVGASSETPDGTLFFANMPTEEVFSSPHRLKTEGYVRITKPAFPFDREVRDAYFRFEQGKVVEYHASKGQDVLDQLFSIEHADRLGEVALVDISSPINKSGILFYETLFDENATCHIAFGRAYPEGMKNSAGKTSEELMQAGVNQSSAHVDVMIGSDTMNVLGTCADGRTVTIMENGHFHQVSRS